tara:strand:+ start:4386 stop:5033 length:648 start_codon:yes stop_codon:yes gene_type:complete
MTKRYYLFVIPIFTLLSCKKVSKDWYAGNEVCECYSQSDFIGFDNTLTSCVKKFNTELNKQKKDTKSEDLENFEKNHLMELSKQLIKICPKYQKDFNTVLLNRYSNRNKENLNQRKDSLLRVIDTASNEGSRYIQLAELEIVNGNFNQAINSVNKSIELNPKMEMSYFVRGFLNHKKGDITNALMDIKTMRDLTKQKDLKIVADLWILNLEQELK